MSLIKSVVFDLGNVLIDWNPRYLYRKLFPTEKEVEWFLENICDDEWNAKHDAGQPFSKGVFELTSLHPQFRTQIHNWYDRWEEMLGGPMDETVKILAELKKTKYRFSFSVTGLQKLTPRQKLSTIFCNGLMEK